MEYMKKKKFKIALAQIKIEQKNIEKNCKKIFERIEEAAKENVDIICFPELATIGYTIIPEHLILCFFPSKALVRSIHSGCANRITPPQTSRVTARPRLVFEITR